jgi:transposase
MDHQTVQLRRDEVVPILAEFKGWLDVRSVEVPPESLIGRAISYTRGQRDKLIRYVDYGFVPIDNNLVENAIRPFVIGRKNLLFSGSPNVAESSAAMYTIIETAKANGHEPFFYLYYLSNKLLRATTEKDIEQLLPFTVSRSEIINFSSHGFRLDS